MNSDKLVIITGGTKGIGKALVDKFFEKGFHVVTCARNSEDLTSMKQDNLSTFQADLSKREEVDAFAKFVLSLGKTIQVLVNNTGVFLPGTVHEEEEGSLEQMINTNLYSAYHLTRALIPALVEAKGDVFNMCSVASVTPYPNGGSYSISKYALYGMTKVLREEMKEKDVRVTAILPGATFTASWEGIEIPEERFMKASDVADAVWGAFQLSKQTCVEDLLIRPQLGDL
ncbi:MAG: SDR family oxidoreductase [Cytophagales bacterium]|nr:SDR family oxidoreductase [Cytophagales bacterium]